MVKKSATDSIKTASKRASQKEAEATTGDLIGNKIADKIRNTSPQNASEINTSPQTEDITPKEIYVLPEKRQQIIDKLRLNRVSKNHKS